MKYLAAYLMLVLGGKEAPTADDVKKVITSVGDEVDDAEVDRLLETVGGQNLDEVVSSGLKKLSSVGGGGGGGAAAGGAAAGAAGAAAEEEESEEEEEEEEVAGGNLFGGDSSDDDSSD